MKKQEKIIRKVWKNNLSGQLLITIPLEQGIKEGDYVIVKRI